MLIYKILLPSEWAGFETKGTFAGSPLDRRSGFIHCSSRAQVAATAARFFPDEPVLVVLALDTEQLEPVVRWEPTPDGQEFPHVYGHLDPGAVAAVHLVNGASAVEAALGDQ